MLIYWIVFIHFAIYMLPIKLCDRQKKKVYILMSFIAIFVLYGMRTENVGIDTSHYKTYFDLYKGYTVKELLFAQQWFKRLDLMFVLLLKGSTYLSNDYHYAIIVIGLVYASLFTSLLYRLKPEYRYRFGYLYYGMYFVCSGLNIMRQAYAVIFLLHAYLSFKEGSKRKTIVLCILAFSCHSVSALVSIIIVIYLLFGSDKNKAKLLKYGSIIGSVAIIVSYRYLFTLLGLSNYLANESADLSFYNIALIVMVLVAWYLRKPSFLEYSAIYEYVETILILSLVCCVLGGVAQGFIRITTCLLTMLPFAVIEKIDYSKRSKNEHYMTTIIFIFVCIYFWHNLSGNIGGVVPFEFFSA